MQHKGRFLYRTDGILSNVNSTILHRCLLVPCSVQRWEKGESNLCFTTVFGPTVKLCYRSSGSENQSNLAVKEKPRLFLTCHVFTVHQLESTSTFCAQTIKWDFEGEKKTSLLMQHIDFHVLKNVCRLESGWNNHTPAINTVFLVNSFREENTVRVYYAFLTFFGKLFA